MRVVGVVLSTGLRGAAAHYLWLAASERVPLCTFDERMAAAARLLSVKVIS